MASLEVQLEAFLHREQSTEEELLQLVSNGRKNPDAFLASLALRTDQQLSKVVDVMIVWIKVNKEDLTSTGARVQKVLTILSLRPKELTGDICRRLSNILTGPYNPITCLTSLEFAEYLTMYDVHQLMNLRLESNDDLRSVLMPFEQRQEKFGLWVATQILTQDRKRKQARYIEFFIQTMVRLVFFRNYNAIAYIYFGINLPAVRRVVRAWEKVRSEEIKNLAAIDSLMSPAQDFYRYRRILERDTSSQRAPVIPVITALLKGEDLGPRPLPSLAGPKERKKSLSSILLDVITRLELFQHLCSLYPTFLTDTDINTFIATLPETKTSEQINTLSSQIQRSLTDDQIEQKMRQMNLMGEDGDSSDSLLSTMTESSALSFDHTSYSHSYGSNINLDSVDDATELIMDDDSDDDEELKEIKSAARPRSSSIRQTPPSSSASSSSSSSSSTTMKKTKGAASFIMGILGASKEPKNATVSLGLYGSGTGNAKPSQGEPDAKGYVYACKIDKIPTNKGLAIKIQKKQVAFFKMADGTIHAMNNTCSHAGVPLVSTTATSDIEEYKGSMCIRCPGHGIRFNVEDGTTSTKKYSQKKYSVKKKGNEVWIKI